MSWSRGRDEILEMLEADELSQVIGDMDLANRLLASARQHLESAERICEEDPEFAYAGIYDAVRKAMAAMLQAQGLRATTFGGHLTVQRTVRAQFEPTMGALLRPVDRIRTTRHAAEYPDEGTYIDSDAVRADLPKAKAVVEAAEQAVPHLPVFKR